MNTCPSNYMELLPYKYVDVDFKLSVQRWEKRSVAIIWKKPIDDGIILIARPMHEELDDVFFIINKGRDEFGRKSQAAYVESPNNIPKDAEQVHKCYRVS